METNPIFGVDYNASFLVLNTGHLIERYMCKEVGQVHYKKIKTAWRLIKLVFSKNISKQACRKLVGSSLEVVRRWSRASVELASLCVPILARIS